MKKNVVFYGDSNHGKSTMVGYIVAVMDGIDISKLETYFNKKFGRYYNPALFYTWIVNKDFMKSGTAYNELTGEPYAGEIINESGESLNNYIRKITFEDAEKKREITLIDTPGQPHRAPIRDEALHLGEIGVFCVEANEVLKPEFGKSHFDNFEIWSTISGEKPLILLTKVDMNLSEEDYLEACERVKLYGGFDDETVIIPVAVIVKERRSTNVFEKAAETPWYSGPTLIEAIKHFSQIQSEAVGL